MTYCALVGAVGVARAVSDEHLSSEILKTRSRHFQAPSTLETGRPGTNGTFSAARDYFLNDLTACT
jgi:hypothetical protein